MTVILVNRRSCSHFMTHEPFAPRGRQMNRRLRTLTCSLSLLFLAAAGRTHAADGLAYVATQHDGNAGVNGLRSAEALALSPDGGNLYAAGSGDSALAVFASGGTANALVVFMRDAATGTLTFIEIQAAPKGPQAIAISSDGKHVYVAAGNDNAVALFSRDPGSGMLTLVQTVKDNTGGVD